MVLKLVIIKQSNSSFLEQLEFNRFPVFLGRESGNQVVLSDPLKIISRKHAKIIYTDGILQLVDLESANFTYLNDEKILANEENALKSNDKIRIGDYELTIEVINEKELNEDDDQKTMVFSSPYAEEIAAIAENLRIISSKFILEDAPAKEKMLKLSVLQNLLGLEKSESNKIIAECLSENFLDSELYKIGSAGNKNINQPAEKNIIGSEEPGIVSSQNKNYNAKLSVQEYSFNVHFSSTVDALLDIFAKLIEGYLQFRQEFFGVTKFYTLPTSSLEEIKEFLFNQNISPDEEKKRLESLKDEAQKLLSHQIGLLEAYNLSVTEGSKMLLQSLDPNVIEKELLQKKVINKNFPFNKNAKILDSIKKHFYKYISDLYYIEKKFFRPSFIRGYQKRM